MNGQKKELYIPLNVIESQDLISGIGGKEIGYIGISLIAGIILAVLLQAFAGNLIFAVIAGGVVVAVTVMLVRRDRFNESMIDKFRFIRVFLKAQKRFEYRYYNIYGGYIDGNGDDGE